MSTGAIPVIDVFAGPGGLNEGFARYSGGRAFTIAASFEMEASAVRTLTLRSAVRALSSDGALYPPYKRALELGLDPVETLSGDRLFAEAMEKAGRHVIQHELAESSRDSSDAGIGQRLKGAKDWVLIGGPPCQAYSLVGRSRRTGELGFYDDAKHTLYREYLHIVEKFKPTIFVMENVKGLLSSRTSSEQNADGTFALILRDMKALGYSVRSLVTSKEHPDPADFVIRAELFGVPQRRHRVILLGVREGANLSDPTVLAQAPSEVTLREAIGDLPRVRSLVSRRDDLAVWEAALGQARAKAQAAIRREFFLDGGNALQAAPLDVPPVAARRYAEAAAGTAFSKWVRWAGLDQVGQHAPRSHMASDLQRYHYLSQLASVGLFPRVTDLPDSLRPNHENLSRKTVPFSDRFKVQRYDRPSSTITSHISKDGHHFIHPDPWQMRSLTVREAARLQTFPDDYYFVGNRTSQYHQVGNAVPPLLAYQIAGVVAKMLGV